MLSKVQSHIEGVILTETNLDEKMQESDKLKRVLNQSNDLITIYAKNNLHFWRYKNLLGE